LATQLFTRSISSLMFHSDLNPIFDIEIDLSSALISLLAIKFLCLYYFYLRKLPRVLNTLYILLYIPTFSFSFAEASFSISRQLKEVRGLYANSVYISDWLINIYGSIAYTKSTIGSSSDQLS
jgi:hypothetical protein